MVSLSSAPPPTRTPLKRLAISTPATACSKWTSCAAPASGTLSEILGPLALENDEEMRRLGLRQSAQNDIADLLPAARAMLQSYADGVNAYIAERGRLAAPEFLLLGRPAPWTITDSLLWDKVLGLWLSGNWRLELQRLALSRRTAAR